MYLCNINTYCLRTREWVDAGHRLMPVLIIGTHGCGEGPLRSMTYKSYGQYRTRTRKGYIDNNGPATS